MKVDFSQRIGKIKPMHAINNGPAYYTSTRFWDKVQEAGIPYARTHDTCGPFGGTHFVDIPNIFKNFDADVNNPESYDFAFTDWLFAQMDRAGIKPFYRLGVTIENYYYIKAYNIFPPKDNQKWAEICEHIIMHYNEGWANGFYYGIEYWEIWNEPDNQMEAEKNPMWQGTPLQFFQLYEVASNHLKKRFPHLKIGGYASCGFYNILEAKPEGQANVSTRTEWFIYFFEEFLKYISSKEHKSPLDFFSWHSYSNLEANIKYAEYAKAKLEKAGFTDTEIFLNEWNPDKMQRGKIKDASNILGMMIGLHSTSLDMLMYYDGRPTSPYCGLWGLENGVLKGYYAFLYFNAVYKLKQQVSLVLEEENLQAIASTDGDRGAITIANCSDEDKKITVQWSGLSAKNVEISSTTEDKDDVKEQVACKQTLELSLSARSIMQISIW